METKNYVIDTTQLDYLKQGFIVHITTTKAVKLINGKPCLVKVSGTKTPDYESVVLPIDSKPTQLMLSNEEKKAFLAMQIGETLEVYRKTVFDSNNAVVEKATALKKDDKGKYIDEKLANYYLSQCKHIVIGKDENSKPYIKSQWDGNDRGSNARYTIEDDNITLSLAQTIQF